MDLQKILSENNVTISQESLSKEFPSMETTKKRKLEGEPWKHSEKMESDESISSKELPPGWKDVPKRIEPITGTNIFCFKTPIEDENSDFHLVDVLQWIEFSKKKVALIVDFNSVSYFNPDDFKKLVDDYSKIPVEGKPNEEQVEQFQQLCKKYLMEEEEDSWIGVTCESGYNVSGYFVIRYLVDCMELDLNYALLCFARSHTPGLYDNSLFQLLLKHYGMNPSDCNYTFPTAFDWKKPIASQETEVPHQPSSQAEKSLKLFGNEIVNPEESGNLKKLCKEISGLKLNGFLGIHPKELTVLNVQLLLQEPYMVTWSSVGKRLMMLITNPNVFLIDEENRFFKVSDIYFPSRKKLGERVDKTLIDGELVIDKEGSEQIPRYLISDILAFEANSVRNQPFEVRKRIIDVELIEPRSKKKSSIEFSKEPFQIGKKQIFSLPDTPKVMKLTQSLPHEHDGLIFYPKKMQYRPADCDNLLKWKKTTPTVVNFKLNVEKKCRPGCLPEDVVTLHVTEGDDYLGPFQPDRIDLTKDQRKNLNGKIISCSWNPFRRKWEFLHVVENVALPHTYSTARIIFENTKDLIPENDLLMFISKSLSNRSKPTTKV